MRPRSFHRRPADIARSREHHSGKERVSPLRYGLNKWNPVDLGTTASSGKRETSNVPATDGPAFRTRYVHLAWQASKIRMAGKPKTVHARFPCFLPLHHNGTILRRPAGIFPLRYLRTRSFGRRTRPVNAGNSSATKQTARSTRPSWACHHAGFSSSARTICTWRTHR